MCVEHNDFGFVCGLSNKFGLQTTVLLNEDRSIARIEFTPATQFQGWKGMVHGGILTALIDEAISHIAIASFKAPTLTAELNIRFKSPALIEEKLTVTAKRTSEPRRLLYAKAVVESEDGRIIAEGTAKIIKANKGVPNWQAVKK